MSEGNTISGFGENGFDFQDFVGSVGANLQQWGLQALNRQAENDAGERRPINAPTVLRDDRTLSQKLTDFVQNNAITVGVVVVAIVAGLLFWRKRG